MKAKIICIEGYWKDSRKPIERRCVVMPKGATDSMRDEILKEARCMSDIFFIFEEGEPILGEHRDFVVEFNNLINEINLGEVQ